MQAIEERATDAEAYRTQIAAMVMSRWDHSRNSFAGFLNKLPTWYNTFKGVYTTSAQSYRNNIHLPILFATTWNDVARKVQMTFSQWPIVQMQGYGNEDAAVARRNETLVSAQMKDAESFKKAVDFYLSADLYGTSVLQYGWRKDVRTEKFRRGNPNSNTPTPVPVSNQPIEEQLVTRFDGPDWVVRDLLDCAPSTNAKYIPDMDYFITRQFLDLDQLRALAKHGFYDAAQVEKIAAVGPSQRMTDDYKERRASMRSPMDDNTILMDRYAKPVQIIEFWGVLPDELIPADGCKHRVITVANGTNVLRNEPNPFWLNEKPFLSYSPMPDPHFCFGIGRIEIGAKMQWTANRIASQKLDVIDLLIDPVIAYDKNKVRSMQELYVRAGRPIPVEGDPREALMPLSFDMRGVQLAYTEIDQLWNWIEQSSGIQRDTVAGGPGVRRQTAREYMGRQEGSLTRLGLEGRLAEEGWIEPLANVMRALNKQYLPTPKALKILGTAGLVNPVTGMPEKPEEMIVSLEDVNADYDVRAVGASQMIGRSTMQQNAVMLLQAISANPIAAQMVNWTAYFRNLFMLMDFKNVDELLNTNEQMQQITQQLQQETNGKTPAQPSDFSGDVLQSLQFQGKTAQNLGVSA